LEVSSLATSSSIVVGVTHAIKDIQDQRDNEDVATVGDGGEVYLVGTVLRRNRRREVFVIGDGTGKAHVAPLTGLPREGSCVYVEGELTGCIGDGCGDMLYVEAQWNEM